MVMVMMMMMMMMMMMGGMMITMILTTLRPCRSLYINVASGAVTPVPPLSTLLNARGGILAQVRLFIFHDLVSKLIWSCDGCCAGHGAWQELGDHRVHPGQS
jgi:hypothetical protein